LFKVLPCNTHLQSVLGFNSASKLAVKDLWPTDLHTNVWVFQQKNCFFSKVLPTTEAADHAWSKTDPWCARSVSLYSLLFFLSAGVDYSVRKRIFFADETRITIAFLLFLLGELLKKVIMFPQVQICLLLVDLVMPGPKPDS
jgi:hypothetical protein